MTTTSRHSAAPEVTGDLPDHATFPALDGVRAIAVAAVVMTHAAFWTGRYVRGPFSPVLARLDSGVAVFFVLSGFLLVRPWLIAARDDSPRPRALAYFWRRALRILPLYWLTVVLALLLLVQRPMVTAADWARHAFLLQIYHFGWLRGGLTHTWSLCTEVAFYIVLPVIGLIMVGWCRVRGWQPVDLLVLCALLVAASLAWPFYIYHRSWGLERQASLWLPAYLSWFAGGIALAVIQVHAAGRTASPAFRRRLATLASAPGCWWAFAGATFMIAATPVAGPLGLSTSATNAAAAVRNLLYVVMAICIVFPTVFSTESLLFRLLSGRTMRRLGEVSYGVFLLHLLILEGVMNLLGYRIFSGSAMLVFAMTSILSVGAAMLSFRLVERPFMRLRHLVRAVPRSRDRSRG